jgi:tetrapyrrole methylase family protein/MazG family protein
VIYSKIDSLLQALDITDLPGLHIHQASALVGMYHPPFNPDIPVLLDLEGFSDIAALKAVLLNQYPAEYEMNLVGQGVESITLGKLESNQAWTALYIPAMQLSSFESFQETIAHLRAPEGCPWDREQTHLSLRPYLLEETYEVLDALDSSDVTDLREELGDLLLQIVLHSQIAIEQGEFRMVDVMATLNEKIIRRHPHVWGSVEVNGSDDVKVNWDKLKKVEKQERKSRLDGVPKALPALSQAFSYQDRAARVKFDWDTIEPVIAKVHEEIDEILTAPDDEARQGEVGDLLFAVVNWARWLGIDPEGALRGTNARFYRRFNYVEQQAAAHGRELSDMTLDEMDAFWNDAKKMGY